jgi:hypothetical protein
MWARMLRKTFFTLTLLTSLVSLFSSCASHDYQPYVGQQQNWPTSPGTFAETRHGIGVYYGYPPRPYVVIGALQEKAPGKFSNAVGDAANAATRIGCDAILVLSHNDKYAGSVAFSNGTVMPTLGGVSFTGTTMAAPIRIDEATVWLIKWK